MATAKQKQNERSMEAHSVTAAPSSAPAPADEVSKARAMIAKVDAAEKAGIPMTEENMKKLGYVKRDGGVWELPIPVNILRQL